MEIQENAERTEQTMNEPIPFRLLRIGDHFYFHYVSKPEWHEKISDHHAFEIKYPHIKLLIGSDELCYPTQEDREQ